MRFTATAALPYENRERATVGLLAELRRQLLAADVHEMSVWETFAVTGPIEFTDLRGRMWHEYRATVESRRPVDRGPTDQHRPGTTLWRSPTFDAVYGED